MEQLFAKQKTGTMLNSIIEEKFPSCSMTITETYTFLTFKGIRWPGITPSWPKTLQKTLHSQPQKERENELYASDSMAYHHEVYNKIIKRAYQDPKFQNDQPLSRTDYGHALNSARPERTNNKSINALKLRQPGRL